MAGSNAIYVEHGRDIVILQNRFLAGNQPFAVSMNQFVLRSTEKRVVFMHARKENVANPSGTYPNSVRLRRIYGQKSRNEV